MTAYLRLLGGAALEDERGALTGPVSHRHPLALLALLAASPSRSMSRAKLVGMLWPEVPEATARNRLGTVLHRVRGALGDAALVSAGKDIELDPDALPSDVAEFEASLRSDDYQRAVRLYGGPFLDGFHLQGAADFETWTQEVRTRFEQGYAAALEALAERAEKRGDHSAAAEWWRRRVDEDPFDSRIVHRWMEALVAWGNRAAALGAARRHTELLEREFQVEPSPEIRELVESLKSGTAGSSTLIGKSPPTGSIAVLPFEDLTGSSAGAELVEGLHCDLLLELSMVPSLLVVSRTSVLPFRGTREPLPEVARQLGVGAVLEGEVQQVGTRVRFRVQLIDAARDTHLWAARYDRELTAENLFALQSDLTREIVRALETETSLTRPGPSDRLPTESLDAYRACVRGRTHLDRRSEAGMRTALHYFRRSLEEDPRYATAWAGLADALGLLASYQHESPEDVLPEAYDAARRALELEPDLAEGYGALGLVHMVRREAPEGIRTLRRAVELRPGFAQAHSMIGFLLSPAGFWEEGAIHMERAALLDPMSPEIHVGLAMGYMLPGRSAEEALAHARRARELAPGYAVSHLLEGQILTFLGRPVEAVAVIRKGLEMTSEATRPRHLSSLAHALLRAGEEVEARPVLLDLKESGDPFFEGFAHTLVGRLDEAFDAFREARWTPLYGFRLRYDPPLDALREDPRYADLLEEVNREWGLDPDGSIPNVP